MAGITGNQAAMQYLIEKTNQLGGVQRQQVLRNIAGESGVRLNSLADAQLALSQALQTPILPPVKVTPYSGNKT